MTLAPIVLFVYNRPRHTLRTLEALAKNELADQSKLYIYADGAKKNAWKEDLLKIKEVVEVVNSQLWCGQQELIKRDYNWGLADNIMDGVTSILNKYGKIIVLEDDIETSKGFLKFMNFGLDTYKLDHTVKSIAGYIEPVAHKFKHPFFLSKGTSWGWATWKRTWDEIEWDINILSRKINQNSRLKKKINFGGYPYDQMIKEQLNCKINSWAIRFYTSCALNNGLHLVPNITLVNNLGFDGSGEHCGLNNVYMDPSFHLDRIVETRKLRVRENKLFPKKLALYFGYQLPVEKKIKLIIWKFFRRIKW